MKPVVIVGYRGRMAKALSELLSEERKAFIFYSESAPASERTSSFSSCSGVIDFSSPELSKKVCRLATEAGIPFICGTTGWEAPEKPSEIFEHASKKIPVFYESNFSIGIEFLARALESLSELSSHKVYITDIHHRHKKDSPSGTAKKIADRLHTVAPEAKIEFRDYRIGENPGEHRVDIDLGEEVLSFSHQAFNRKIFARGALKALLWAQKQEPGIYQMKDMLL
jgi:4-hydroxy-tetrahydrodipicolinate reductase